MRHPLYLLFGVAMLALLGLTSYSGIPLFASKANEAKVVPRTVRDNPGAYRSVYGVYPHYVGGK
jgi:hypothetical protein